jgi:nitronate monooxygenase
LLRRIGIELPIVQAPMGGVSTPEMAAAVSNAGGLGSIGIGAADPDAARGMIRAVRALTAGPFNVNAFCHAPAKADAARGAAWVARLAPEFARYGATPPASLREIYISFRTDTAAQAILLEEKPPVVSFHFGLPSPDVIAALRDAGVILLATATGLAEGKVITAAGIDAVVAQGYEAGGHRGVLDPSAPDDRLGTMALRRLLVKALDTPVVATGGIMDGAGIVAALALGAAAAQLGTAFVACPESAADAGYRVALLGPAAEHTAMTSAISGRPARCLANRFTALGAGVPAAVIPDYPVAYDAGKALHAAARAKGEFGYVAQWAGQGAPLARALPAAVLVARLKDELAQARSPG